MKLKANSHPVANEKRWVLRSDLKWTVACVLCSGSKFPNLGAATAKPLSPLSFCCVLGKFRSSCSVDLKDWESTCKCKCSERGLSRARHFKDLKTK